MVSLSTTQLSTKGQVVIPEEIRVRLGLEPGRRFVVVAEEGVIILKTIDPPDLASLRGALARVRTQARKAGLRHADLEPAIKRARKRP